MFLSGRKKNSGKNGRTETDSNFRRTWLNGGNRLRKRGGCQKERKQDQKKLLRRKEKKQAREEPVTPCVEKGGKEIQRTKSGGRKGSGVRSFRQSSPGRSVPGGESTVKRKENAPGSRLAEG